MNFAAQYRASLIGTLNEIDVSKVAHAIDWLREARDQGRTVFVCGNGGSAATASHFVCDMLKGASYGREKRFRIIALNDSLPTLTAYSNDVSYDHAFVEQLKNFAGSGDVVMALSGSGNSANVLHAIEYGNSIGCRTIALSGRGGGKLGPLAQLNLQVSEGHMGRIEDAHMAMCHMICYYFMEAELLRPAADEHRLGRVEDDVQVERPR
jgi:D-sedoheptulose 7-phosphate isomerase